MNSELLNIAKLAHLSFTPQELEEMEKDISALTDMVKELPCNTEEEPSSYNAVMELRSDTAQANKYARDDLLSNAPLTVKGCFAIPKTVE